MSRGAVESFGDRRGRAAAAAEVEEETVAVAADDPGTTVLQLQPLPVMIVPTIDEDALEQARQRLHTIFYDTARAALEQAVADVADGQPAEPVPPPAEGD